MNRKELEFVATVSMFAPAAADGPFQFACALGERLSEHIEGRVRLRRESGRLMLLAESKNKCSEILVDANEQRWQLKVSSSDLKFRLWKLSAWKAGEIDTNIPRAIRLAIESLGGQIIETRSP